MLKTIFAAILPFLMLFGSSSDLLLSGTANTVRDDYNGTLEKMIVANGSVSMDLNLTRLGGRKGTTSLRFASEADSFFTVLVFNDELRTALPSAMNLVPQGGAILPGRLNASYNQLSLEVLDQGEQSDLVVRDNKTGFTFFTVEGYQFSYDPSVKGLTISDGRLLISKEFAADLGRSASGGTIAGKISMNADMRPIEVTTVTNGESTGQSIPGIAPEAGTRPGPDVVVGDVSGLAQFGAATGTQVGLALATDSCNYGAVNLNWFQLPSNDHPVIPQNLYRMSGGATNDERFEQVGQSSVKHAFTALTNNICGLGCNGTGGTQLGSGCSDPYSASLNSGPSLGSRAWINPYTGAYPRGDSPTPPNDHSGHSGDSAAGHRLRVEVADLNTTLNAGATYYAEGQYVTPHEYAWCQANPTQCNQNNNVSYRRYSVNGTTCNSGQSSCYSFSAVGTTNREKAAIIAWTGATIVKVEPVPGTDGIAFVGYKVTNPSAGVWHYEYAVYNQDLDRAIQSFSIPIGGGVTVTNAGFHAPPQQPGSANDGTVGSAGFSSTPWSPTLASGSLSWASETMFANANANAIRWGTLYNFRFDSNRPPVAGNATVGYFKAGSPSAVAVQVPQTAITSASISGRVTNPAGTGLGGVQIVLTNPGNVVVGTTLTSPFGYYSFENITPGGNFTISASTKRYTINPLTFAFNDNLTGVDLVSQ